MITTTRRIAAVAAGAALVLVAVWYLALFHPATQKLASAHKAQAAAEQNISKLHAQVGQLQALQKQIPADTAKLAVLKTDITADPSLATALVQLHQAATRSGATLSAVGPAAPTAAAAAAQTSGPPSIALTMTASGSYGQLMAFLRQLAALPRTLVVDTLDISGTSPKLTANLSARIFYTSAASH